jgi:hypothetical protein
MASRIAVMTAGGTVPTKARKPAFGTVTKLSRLIAEVVFQPSLRPDGNFRRNATDSSCDRGDRDVMKMADDILPRQDEHGALAVRTGKAKLPNLPAIYFGHDCAFRTGANSSWLTGWRV